MKNRISKSLLAAAVLSTIVISSAVNADDWTQGMLITGDKTISSDSNFSNYHGVNQGVLVNWGTGTVTVTGDSTALFENNTGASDAGGALYNAYGGTVIIDAVSEFTGNNANRGGAVWNNGNLRFEEKAIFDGNSALTTSVSNDYAGGAIINSKFNNESGSGDLAFNKGVVFSNNHAIQGGAIKQGGNLTVTGDAVFQNNTADLNGGAVLSAAGWGEGVRKDSYDSITASGNIAGQNGGAFYIGDADGVLQITESGVFQNNQAKTGSGGAIYNVGVINAQNVSFGELVKDAKGNIIGAQNGNKAASQGGAIMNASGADTTLSGSVIFAGNNANQGGAISNIDASFNVTGDNSLFVGNTAVNAGAISNVSTAGNKAELVIGNGALFKDNSSTAYAGAILNQNSNMSIGSNAKFINNSSGSDNGGNSGGAIAIDSNSANDTPSYVTIGNGALFQDNNSTKSAGAVYLYESGGEVSLSIGNNSQFKNNTATVNGGAIAVYGASGTTAAGDKGVSIGEGALFEGNSATGGSGGAIYAADFGGHSTDIIVNGNTEFKNNTSSDKGGAIYNASQNFVLDTTEGSITFTDNKANEVANDIFAAENSTSTITGTNSVSIGSGLVSESNSIVNIKDTSSMVIEETAIADIGGQLTSDTGAYLENKGTVNISGQSSANLLNENILNVSGTVTGDIENHGDLFIEDGGSLIANVIQDEADSNISVAAGGIFGTNETLQAGSLTVADGGKIDGVVNVTEAVEVNVGSAIFDATGLVVGGEASNGHIAGAFNLKDTNVTMLDALTSDLTISGTSQLLPSTQGSPALIGDGSSANTLTLSNGSISAAGGNGFEVTNSATLKLSPDAGNSMTLNENVSGNGLVLVDEKITKVDNPDFDPDLPEGPDNQKLIDKPWGVGTVNVTSDNSNFVGEFIQKMGTVIAQAGSKFFGGTTNTVQGGTLVLQNGADITSNIDVIANPSNTNQYGTVNIYNKIDGVVGEDGINRISADSIANGYDSVIGYINSDDTTVDVNISAGGLGLFNGTRVEGDLTLYKGSGVRDLTFGNGSGSEADKITLNESTKLTYTDGAYIKDNSAIEIGSNASLNFANNSTNIDYKPSISSTDDTAVINKTGAGTTNISSSLENYHGSVNVYNGALNLVTPEDKYLSSVTIDGGSMDVAGNLAIENQAATDGKLVVNNGVLTVEKAIETNDSVMITGSNLSVGDYLSVGEDSSFVDSFVNIATDFNSIDNVTIDNTQLVVGGESYLGNVAIKGDKSNVTLNKDSQIASLTMTDNSVLNNRGNINLVGDFTMGTVGSSSSQTINMQSGAINTIVADNVILNSASNILFDVDPRTSTTDQIISNNPITGTGSLLIGGINFTTSPIDRNVTFDISNLLTDPTGGNPDKVVLPDGGVVANTAMGQYQITASGAGNPILNASLLNLNPQMYRGQVATLATWQNQLVVNNMLFDHMNVLTNQLMNESKTANLRAAAYPQFAPYQYSVKDGSLWYKAYGNFERLSMTKGLSVGNNAYGSLIGADFPQISLKRGWNLIPTAYIAYNGAHQTFNGVSMYQNGAQLGFMGTAYKGDFITSLLAYGGGYANDMTVRGEYGSGSDTTGNWFAGVASKTAYNFHLPCDFIFQPTFMAAYNAFGSQNWGSNFGAMSMSSGMFNGINVAPGFNLIWQKKTFSLYATAQMVYNIMGGVDGQAGNIDLGYVRMRHSYFEYGLGVMKKFKDTFNGYLQFTIRNGGRTGIGFQGGLQWKLGKD